MASYEGFAPCEQVRGYVEVPRGTDGVEELYIISSGKKKKGIQNMD